MQIVAQKFSKFSCKNKNIVHDHILTTWNGGCLPFRCLWGLADPSDVYVCSVFRNRRVEHIKMSHRFQKEELFRNKIRSGANWRAIFLCSGTDSVLKVYRRSRTFDSLKSDAQSKFAILFLALCMSGPSVLHFMIRKTVKQESAAIFLPWKLKMLSLCNHHLQEAYSSQGCSEPCMNCVRLDWAPVDKHDWSFALNVFCIGAQPRRKKNVIFWQGLNFEWTVQIEIK